MKISPSYDLDKIKFATDGPTFEKAVGLYESGKVTEFEDTDFTFTATVLGTQPYKVFVSSKNYDTGGCDCYLGKNNTLCKHMVAVAIYAVMRGKKLTDKDKKSVSNPTSNGRLGILSKEELAKVKKVINDAMRYIKPYNGPSRIWFVYQSSLSEGCNRLAAILSELPVGGQIAGLLVDLLLRLDKKLSTGGVDDSDGTVGTFIQETVEVLKQYAELEPACLLTFRQLQSRETCFGWEEPLLELISGKNIT